MKRNTVSWNFYRDEIEDHARNSSYQAEAARLGVAGVQAQLTEYSWQIDQPDVVAAMKYAKEAAHELGLQYWLHLDPRDAVASFLAEHPGARQHTVVPVEAALRGTCDRPTSSQLAELELGRGTWAHDVDRCHLHDV